MSLAFGEGNEDVDRLLRFLERVFGIALCLFLLMTIVGQFILSTPEGRSRFSRIDRLEGIKLNMDDPIDRSFR
ncbi:MAG: hypothetical protein GX668_05060 [Firmicutes bacterium]|jgi:hypothetical protein|nr:hypothetical protein [Bacillota bacterium]HAV21110.1 hypothetical protein [Bacillota bacterium]